MSIELERVKKDTPPAEICGLLERDGAVIVEDILSDKQLVQLNADLDTHIVKAGPGLRHPSMENITDFYGHSTVRIDGLPAKSDIFLEAMLLPQLCKTADHFLLAQCQNYLLSTGQVIEIGPGQAAQELHFDESAWSDVPWPRPQLQIEAMFALSDFTFDNGATQVVPGSHKWPRDRKAKQQEITYAEMKAGSALIYLGTTIHGGGANTTMDEKRRGMFLGYVVGWLRTEENLFLTVPFENVRNMPERIQELLGYQPHYAIGVADVGNPMALFK